MERWQNRITEDKKHLGWQPSSPHSNPFADAGWHRACYRSWREHQPSDATLPHVSANRQGCVEDSRNPLARNTALRYSDPSRKYHSVSAKVIELVQK